ncbi:MAG: Flp pilus assembly complex ATPase component TadA, partial [Elusimicrobia bacterium]|nr:Flp pilus assembly complex ATPase component TadA [Elusimicrobiota bacterium]
SMTGHLVFSTLHTNDAVSTISRLLDLKVEPYLIASSLTGVLAQRLVRAICTHCREEYQPPADVIKKIEAHLGEEVSFLFYRGKGCEKCQHTGYRGRIGVHEFLDISGEVRQAIRQGGASEGKIRDLARKSGMKSLLDDALEKVKQGITTMEEVERILILMDEPASAKEALCPQCEETVQEDWKKCPYCGAHLKGTPEPPAVAAPPPAPAPSPAQPPSQALNWPSHPPLDRTNAHPLDFTGFKVLVVDDDQEMLRALVLYLLKNKFSVSIAANGQEAMELVSRDKPHVLITDVLMPSMDGLELLRTLRADVTTAFIPVIILSQKSAVEDRLKGFEVGTDDYISKPFSPDEMLYRIRAVLKRVYA